MATIDILDLNRDTALTQPAMSTIRGGRAALFWSPTYESLAAQSRRSRSQGGAPQTIAFVHQDVLNVYNVTNNFYDIGIAAADSNITLNLDVAEALKQG